MEDEVDNIDDEEEYVHPPGQDSIVEEVVDSGKVDVEHSKHV